MMFRDIARVWGYVCAFYENEVDRSILNRHMPMKKLDGEAVCGRCTTRTTTQPWPCGHWVAADDRVKDRARLLNLP